MNKRTFTLLSLLILSILAAVVGLGRSYNALITPRSIPGYTQGIDGDSWIRKNATIKLSGLAASGNTLQLQFNPWRPDHAGPGALRVSVCGEGSARFVIDSSQTWHIPLRGTCNPREVSFQFENPFVPGGNDFRELGNQFETIRVSSRFGFPLVSLQSVFIATVLIFAIALLIYHLTGMAWIGGIIPVLSLFLLSSGNFGSLQMPAMLGSVVLLFLIGLLLAKRSSSEESGNKNIFWVVIAGFAVVIGAVLRFSVLDFGLPANFHPDEVPKVNALIRMEQYGDLNPRYFLHPSFLLYSGYFMKGVLEWFGVQGSFEVLSVLGGRTASALAGTISIWLTYCIGKRVLSPAAGSLGALFLAVSSLHITCSRYMKEDAILTFWILCAVLLVLKAVQEDRRWILFPAALVGGFSCGTKYSGLLSIVILWSAPWLRSGKLFAPDVSYLKTTALATVLFPAGFILATPYSVLDSTKFLKDFHMEKRHMSRGHTISIDAWSQYWMYHFSRSILKGMSYLPAFAAVLGAGLVLFKRRMMGFFLVGLVLLYYLPAEYVKAKPAPQPERYILPCIPFIALLAGSALVFARSQLPRIAPVLIGFFVAFPLIQSVKLTTEVKNDTRDRMAVWMKENIPAGSTVLIDWKPYEPRFFNNEFQYEYLPRADIISHLSPGSLRTSNGDYLLLSSLFYERYFTQPHSNAALRQRIRDVFDQVPVVKQVAPEYGTYGFHNPTITLFSLKDEDFDQLQTEQQLVKAGKKEFTENEVRAAFRWRIKEK